MLEVLLILFLKYNELQKSTLKKSPAKGKGREATSLAY
jgi:hypothetical protein